MQLFDDLGTLYRKATGKPPKNKKQKKIDPFAQYKRQASTKYFTTKRKQKDKMIKVPRVGLITFFTWLLGIHTKQDKLNSRKNADPQDILEQKAVNQYAKALKFPATILSNKEKTEFHRMGLRYQTVQKMADKRFVWSICSEVFPMIWTIFKFSTLSILAFIFVPILVWFAIGLVVQTQYKNWATHQQGIFDVIMVIIAPYLYGMNQVNANSNSGSNSTAIESIINTVEHRVDNHSARDAVATLGIDIRYNPTSFTPYAIFARKFSTSPTAYMFMHSVYNIAQGSSDISAIRELVSDIMHDLMEQVRKIEHTKLRRFTTPPIIMFLDWFYLIMCYFIIYAYKLLVTTMSQTKVK